MGIVPEEAGPQGHRNAGRSLRGEWVVQVKGGMGANLGEKPGVAQGKQKQCDAWRGHKAESEA